MPLDSSPASTYDLPIAPIQRAAMPEPLAPSVDERWAAWRARGAAHDRAVRRRMAVAVPLIALAAAILYALLIR